MSKLFSSVKNMRQEKRHYKEMQRRAKALPEEYSFVFYKIEHYMWQYASGSGIDMTLIFADLLDLFEASAADGKRVLEITGTDVAAFCDELLRNAKTYTAKWRNELNQSIMKKLGGKNDE